MAHNTINLVEHDTINLYGYNLDYRENPTYPKTVLFES